MSDDRTIEQIVLQLEKEGREATLKKNDIAATSELLMRQVRFTRIYAKPLGQWRVVSAHNTLIQ